ncbi:outer membrane protein assembly factor [Candidatus Dependentiae bacterium]|nr:outer membrane protein assembly factor [Candidatus Dependentiae bacterium]
MRLLRVLLPIIITTFFVGRLFAESEPRRSTSGASAPLAILLLQEGELVPLQQKVIAPLVDKQLLIDQLTVSADDGTTADDIAQWTGVTVGQQITKALIQRLQYYLHLAQRYTTATLLLTPTATTMRMQITLQAGITVQSVTVQGIWIGRQQMRALYGIERGAMLQLPMHRSYIVQMQRMLRDQGYLHAKVFDTLRFYRQRHQVDVTVTVNRGDPVFVTTVAIVVHGSPWHESIKQRLTEQLRAALSVQLVLRSYSKSLLASIEQITATQLATAGLLRHKLWLDEELQGNSIAVTVHIDIAENKQIIITGNKIVVTTTLMRHIMATDEAAWFLSEPFLQQVILRYYQDQGYTGTTVRVKEAASSWDITVNEGIIHRPAEPVLYGISPAYHEQIAKFFVPFSHSDLYQQQLLQQGVTQLLSWYRAHGFWDVSIVKIDLQEIGNALAPVIIVEEGEQRLFAGIVAEQLPEPLVRQLRHAFIPGGIPVPFDSGMIPRIIDRVRLIDATVTITGHAIQQQAKGCTLVLHGKQHHATRFGNCIIRGVPVPLARLLERELLVRPGDCWRHEPITQTVDAISAIGVFKAVHARSAGLVDPQGQAPLLLQVIHDDPFEVRTRFGFAGVSKNLNFSWGGTYKLGGTMLAKSAVAYADQLRVDADFSRFYQHGELSYRYPWLLRKPIRTAYKIFATKFDQPLSWGSSVRLYTASRIAQSIGCSAQHQTASWGITTWLEGLKIAGLATEAAAAIAFNPALVDAWVPYWSSEALGRLTLLDDQTNPCSGYTATVAAKVMAPLNERGIVIGKFLAEQSLFVPIGRNIVGAIRCRFGYISINSFCNLLPSERFYLGGAATIRSYAPDFAPPLGVYCQCCNSSDCKDIFIPMGGSRMINANIELRITPWRQIQLVIFQDLGILANSVAQSGLLTATGLGLRYLTPLGPIRFDVGVRPHKIFPTDTCVGWFLTFGQAF